MSRLIEVWTMPRWSLTPLDELLMLAEGAALIVVLGLFCYAWQLCFYKERDEGSR